MVEVWYTIVKRCARRAAAVNSDEALLSPHFDGNNIYMRCKVLKCRRRCYAKLGIRRNVNIYGIKHSCELCSGRGETKFQYFQTQSGDIFDIIETTHTSRPKRRVFRSGHYWNRSSSTCLKFPIILLKRKTELWYSINVTGNFSYSFVTFLTTAITS